MSARRFDIVFALVSGLMLNLGFIVPELWMIVLVGIAPWISTLRTVNGKESWRLGYVFGLAFGAGQLAWLGQLTFKWTGSFWLGLVPFVLATVLYALYFGLVAVLIQRCWARGQWWLIPVVWAGVEVFRSYIPTFAFPWGLMATPLAEIPGVLGIGYFGTIFLGSALVVLFNVLLLIEWRPKWIGFAILGAFLMFCWIFQLTTPSSKSLRVAVGQTGVDMAFTEDAKIPDMLQRAVAHDVRLARAGGAKVLCLTEGMAGTRKGELPDLPFDVPTDLPLLFGARRGTDPAFQSAYVVEDGKYRWADKTRLVVFGEFVPFRDQLPFLQAFHLPTGDMVAGQGGVQTLSVAGTVVGPMVCFESLFPDISFQQRQKGAQWLWVPGIHDWFNGTTAPYQLRQAAIWRSAECRCPIVQSTPTGITFIASPNVIKELPPGPADVAIADIRLTEPSAVWLQAIFPIVSFLVALAMLLLPNRVFGRATVETPAEEP
jgi:apolipoprotein N-acyltransferase